MKTILRVQFEIFVLSVNKMTFYVLQACVRRPPPQPTSVDIVEAPQSTLRNSIQLFS